MAQHVVFATIQSYCLVSYPASGESYRTEHANVVTE